VLLRLKELSSMSVILSVHKLGHNIGSRELFSNISFGINKGDRISLIGPNGAGKSTLFKIIAGQIKAENGECVLGHSFKIGYLDQEPSFLDEEATIFDVIKGDNEDYTFDQRVYELIERFDFIKNGFDETTKIGSLSGGWKKRVALAREMLVEPDLLLLDEPTNHLDLKSIFWLENFIHNSRFATFTITHDRSFLQNVSDTIIELNKSYSTGFLKVNGNYQEFCEIKANLLSSQDKNMQTASQHLKKEIEWMRKSPRARATKSQARVKKALELEEDFSEMKYRSNQLTVKFEFNTPISQPKILIEAQNISGGYPDKEIFNAFDIIVDKNSRIALMGNNGCGKTTLIKTLLGELKVASGKLKQSDQLVVTYLNQTKEFEDNEKSLLEYFMVTSDKVKVCDKWVSIYGYLARFGFDQGQYKTKIKNLSGGERSRLLLAKLMLTESNLIVLDEPTNDLDLETLNSLEEELKSFKGAIVLISHDRYFVDQVCDEIYAFCPNGESKNLTSFAGINQWQNWYQEQIKSSSKQKLKKVTESVKENVKSNLSYLEKKEITKIEKHIAKYENILIDLEKKLETLTDLDDITKVSQEIASAQNKIKSFYDKWTVLNEKA